MDHRQPRNSSLINQEVGANKRFARTQTPFDDETRRSIAHVIQRGYVVIEHGFSDAEVEEAITELHRIASGEEAGPTAAGGRNKFEGLNTHRIYALLNKSRVFDKFAIHPRVLALNDYFLDPGYQLNAYHSIFIQPGENPQTLHHDDSFITIPRPHRPFGTAIMVALDAFTETNGATVVVPGSHRWGAEPMPTQEQTVPVLMPRGSIVYFLGTLWHGGGQNKSSEERRSLTVQYCQPWVRPFENQILAVDWDKLDIIPDRLVDMLGYKVASPFIGYVDGVSPRRAVARLLRRRKDERLLRQKL
ncbi:uncharacterized protein JN550_010944 [Neoarthrinium moseri]|uniref:uncharacterized protein n=1 Tax=Neoarthrinium moseri TaxID=1658444 RepID=UPI001FDCB1FC|nr:uncharacterized protein JN550_010944 [Neoarthrinium moseri]KAI1861265.1 hypothetical protein JN550_010944 [Neoarthrinium moseri]